MKFICEDCQTPTDSDHILIYGLGQNGISFQCEACYTRILAENRKKAEADA